jgi:O-glycosyl hydrolase
VTGVQTCALPISHSYVFQQLYKFVKPGFQRIDLSTSLPKMTVSAFVNRVNGVIVITGKNDSNTEQHIEGLLKNTSKVSTLRYYCSDDSHNFSRGADVEVLNQKFSKIMPPFCVFTLVSNPR